MATLPATEFELRHHASPTAATDAGGGIKWTHVDILHNGRKVGEVNHQDDATNGSAGGITAWKRTFYAAAYPAYAGMQTTALLPTAEQALQAAYQAGLFQTSSNYSG